MGFRVEVSIQVIDDGDGKAGERVIWGAGRSEVMPPAEDGAQACLTTLGKVKELTAHAQGAVLAQGEIDLGFAREQAALAPPERRDRPSGGHR